MREHLLLAAHRQFLEGDVQHYVVAGDVSAHVDHAGRAGWSWYTGSAGWMFRAGLESILGLERRGESFRVDPCIPSSWPEYAIVWRVGGSVYEITVENPERRCRGVRRAELDGSPVDPGKIPLQDAASLLSLPSRASR